MSDIKMSDVFELPLQSGCLIGFKHGVRLFSDDGVTPQDMATNAINNHDRLTAENEALREACEQWKGFFLSACNSLSISSETGAELLEDRAKYRYESQALREEVERLREDNQLHRRQNGSLTQQVIDRGQELDQLKADNQSLKMKYDLLLTKIEAIKLRDCQRDAEVIERFLITEAPRIDASGPNPIDPDLHHCEWALYQERERLHVRASQLRQQAKENSHG